MPGVGLARSVLWLGALAMVGAVVLALALAGLGLAAWVLLPEPPFYGVMMLFAAGVAVAWSAFRVARTRLAEAPVVVLLAAEAPELYRMVAELADGLGVPPPSKLAVAPGTRPRLLAGDGGLVIPACWLWWLTVWELRQALAVEVVLGPAMAQGDIADAYRIVRRIDAAQVEHYGHPFIRRPLGALQSSIASRAAALDQILADWANRRSAAVTDPDFAAIRWQADFAADAWSVLLDRFAVQAWAVGVSPRALGEGTRGFAAALVSAGLVNGAPEQRRDSPAASTLLFDPTSVDERVSMLANTNAGGESRRLVEWSDYIAEVIDPGRRRRASALVSSVDRVEGRTGPASVSRVLACLEAGGFAAVAAGLTDNVAGETPQDRSERMVVTLHDHVWGLISCALVDEGVATDHLDWILGHCLVHSERVVDLSAPLQVASSSGNTSALCLALSELGSDTVRPVWIAGQEEAAPRMRWAMAAVKYRWKLYDIVVCQDRLLLLVAATGIDLKGGLDRLSGNTANQHRRLTAILRGRVDELVASSPDNEVLLLRDIVGVRVRAGRLFATWTCTIRLTDGRQAVLRNVSGGRGSARSLVNQLAPVLGDRLLANPRLQR